MQEVFVPYLSSPVHRSQGGHSHAVLVDGGASVVLEGCAIEGLVQSTERGWEGIKRGGNTSEGDVGVRVGV